MKKPVYVVSQIWIAAAVVYAIYEAISETGLFSKILSWELTTLGRAWVTPTAVATAMIYALPGFVGLKFTKEQSQPDPVKSARTAATVLLTAGTLIILAGLGAYAVGRFYKPAQSAATPDAQSKLGFLNLNQTSEPPPLNNALGWTVSGTLHREIKYSLEEKGAGPDKTTVYCPLVASNWKPSDPVRIFLHTDVNAYIAVFELPTAAVTRGYKQINFSESSPIQTTIEGTLTRNALPDYARNYFEKAGVRISEDNLVLEAKPFLGQSSSTGWNEFARTSWIAAFLGLIIGAPILFAGALALNRAKKQRLQNNISA
ncbi:MAG TPA: hypothetical protein VKM94_12330 [Blastocatellia bacterium]|nr:hypothetical protein [Blastocatellia bacterium]